MLPGLRIVGLEMVCLMFFKCRYKRAIRLTCYNFEGKLSARFANKLLQGDLRAFWAAWNAEFCAKNCANIIIEYITNASHIAQGFASHFADNVHVYASNVNPKRFMQTYDNYCMLCTRSTFAVSYLFPLKCALLCLV